jgi:hypothetical protein
MLVPEHKQTRPQFQGVAVNEQKSGARVAYFEAFVGRFGPSKEHDQPVTFPSDIVGEGVLLGDIQNLSLIGIKERHFQTALPIQPHWRVIAAKGRPFILDCTSERPYEEEEKNLQKLDGRFCFVAADSEKLMLVTDLLGCSAIYYYQHRDVFYFSTHLGLLIASLKDRPDIDELGLATMIAGSCCINGRTIYSGVRRLGAGQYLEVSRANSSMTLKNRSYASPTNLFDPSVTCHNAERRFEELLRVAVDRERADGPYDVMLSDGLDSTAICLALVLNSHNDIRASTYGEWRSREMRGARHFAATHGITHIPIPYGRWKLGSEARLIAALSRGGAGLQVEHNTIGFKRAARHFSRVAVGFLGDALTGAHLPNGIRTEIDMILPFKRMLDEKVRMLFRDEFHEIEAEIKEIKRNLSGLTDIQKMFFLDLTIRQATWISTTFDQCGWHVAISYPFYHRELMKFCCALSWNDLKGQRLYKEWVRRTAFSTEKRPMPLHNPSWAAYRKLQRVLDFAGKFLPAARPVVDVNWKKRIAPLRPWLLRLNDRVTSPKLCGALEAQLKHTDNYLALLVLAGVALGTVEK